MRYSVYFSILLAAFSFFLFPSVTHADFDASDNSISAIIHITAVDGGSMGSMNMAPINNPTANSPLQMELSFKDTQNKFQLKNCTCMLTITQPKRLPYTQQVTVKNFRAPTNNTEIVYNFPSPATYTMTLTGKPNDSSFAPFTLKWQIPVGGKFVSTPKAKHPRQSNIGWYIGIVIALILGLAYWQFYYKAHKKQRTTPPSNPTPPTV
ncbi:MAG: hypothetical protein ACR2LN_01175 [Candidatus Levyibacteriota bacterium]